MKFEPMIIEITVPDTVNMFIFEKTVFLKTVFLIMVIGTTRVQMFI